MFGLPVNQIIEGHIKEFKNEERELYEERIEICKKCPLYSISAIGEICDSKKCVNPEKQEVVEKYPNNGSICGCGCRLSAKTRLKSAKCVLSKW